MKRRWLAVILLAMISGNLVEINAVDDVDILTFNVSRIIDLFKIVESSDIKYRDAFLTFLPSEIHKLRDAELNDASGIKFEDVQKLQGSLLIWEELIHLMKDIDGIYDSIKYRITDTDKDKLPFYYEQLMDLTKYSLENSTVSILSAIKNIKDDVYYYFESLQTDQKLASQICFAKQTPQQFLFHFYKMIEHIGIKGSIVMQFSSIYAELHNNGTARQDFIKSVRNYYEQTKKTLKAVKSAMAVAPAEFRRCEPSVHQEDSTYTELKEFIQGYIINEVDMSSSGSCEETCGWYRHTWDYRCYDHKLCSKHRRCKGKVRDCRSLHSESWACPSKKKSSRYQKIEDKSGHVYGHAGTCESALMEARSWPRWLVECSYCWCFCEDNGTDTERYFSLKVITSNIEDNRVVTGIKLSKVNKVIHLQIQEGKLLPRGEILQESVQWKDVDESTIEGINGKDYHTLDWDNRAIDLDDLVAPKSHLLTGVRFTRIDTRLRLEIRVTPFEFATGLLMKTSAWLNVDDIKNPAAVEEARTELKPTLPDVPTHVSETALPDSKPNQYVKFGTTDFEKDVGQSTIPFLDIQPVATNPSFPLSGAGIFHKGSKGSGGFVAVRIKTYDFSNHLDIDELPLPVIGVNEKPAV